MALAFLTVIFGLALLVWSAARFVEAAACIARHFGMPPLFIGMVVVGFGTSMPEMLVSALSAAQGNAGIALGNAYGSNITNIALILGVTALVSPMVVHSRVLRKELPILLVVTALAAWQLRDGLISRFDAAVLLVVFAGLMTWTIGQGLGKKGDALGRAVQQQSEVRILSRPAALGWLLVGLALLIVSSRILIWGAVEIAQGFGVGDLVIGLTIVAVGTSLPELASSVMAARKAEHDIALGNILGSNLFNTLAVVGVAAGIRPLTARPEVFNRHMPIMAALTLALFFVGYGFRGPGRISRFEGALLLACYLGYTAFLLLTLLPGQAIGS